MNITFEVNKDLFNTQINSFIENTIEQTKGSIQKACITGTEQAIANGPDRWRGRLEENLMAHKNGSPIVETGGLYESSYGTEGLKNPSGTYNYAIFPELDLYNDPSYKKYKADTGYSDEIGKDNLWEGAAAHHPHFLQESSYVAFDTLKESELNGINKAARSARKAGKQ